MFPNGTWLGNITETMVDANAVEQSATFLFGLTACDGDIATWTEQGNRLEPTPVTFMRESRTQAHLLYLVHASPRQPGWEEVTTYSFLVLDKENAVILWTRAVNNTGTKDGSSVRYFYSHAFSKLRRSSSRCDRTPTLPTAP